jgi:hypothetical protein
MNRTLGHATAGLRLAAILCLFAGCGDSDVPTPATAENATYPDAQFATRVHLPVTQGQARVPTRGFGPGVPTLVCSSCHASREAMSARPHIEDVKEVHVGMQFTHGDLSCTACHDPANAYDTFRLADGRSVEYQDVMDLCSQCHGPQRTAYDHGAHGGMTGYWDLSRGPRDKNACPVCHDPHAPAFPKMRPTFKPRDRFLSPTTHAKEAPHGP